MIPPGKSDPELERLLKESSASQAEITEEGKKWWERNKGGSKRKRIWWELSEVIEAERECTTRLAEIGKTKGLTYEELYRLRYDAIAERDRIITKAAQSIQPEGNERGGEIGDSQHNGLFAVLSGCTFPAREFPNAPRRSRKSPA